jgi:hypothetical protein
MLSGEIDVNTVFEEVRDLCVKLMRDLLIHEKFIERFINCEVETFNGVVD